MENQESQIAQLTYPFPEKSNKIGFYSEPSIISGLTHPVTEHGPIMWGKELFWGFWFWPEFLSLIFDRIFDIFGRIILCCVEGIGYPIHNKIFSNIPGLCPLQATTFTHLLVTDKNVSRHCQMDKAIPVCLRNNGLVQFSVYWIGILNSS